MSSIPDLLRRRARETPDAEAFRVPSDQGWSSLPWAEVERRVSGLALGLVELGSGPHTCVAILSGTRLEWILADLAVLATGAATTTVYPASSAEETAYVLSDSASTLVIAENSEQVAKLRSIREQIPQVRHVLVIEGEPDEEGWVVPLDTVHAEGDYDAMVDAVGEGDLATLIYTSGTTGRPKGVELTHANWLATARGVAQTGLFGQDDVHYLWLPLAHAFGKLLVVVVIDLGMPTAVDGRVDRVAANLREIRPTVMAAAPRVFEKVHATVLGTVQQAGGAKARLFAWAQRVGLRVSRARQRGLALPLSIRLEYALADRLVFSRLRQRFGGRIRYFISGSAPLSPDIAEFFDAAGLVILEGYGLTETAAGNFLNMPDSYRFGTVGMPLPGVKVRIADDGEVLIAGPGVMRGYHGLPEETATTLKDGWLHTGDIGSVDEAGRLRITDRKKELIKTSGGKYVAPAVVEGRLKAACPHLSHVFVHGERRRFVSALVTLDMEVAGPWAESQGLSAEPEQLRHEPRMRTEVQQAVDAVNARLARHETIKRFDILPRDFAVESGELTASFKMRRRVIAEEYQEYLDSLYEE